MAHLDPNVILDQVIYPLNIIFIYYLSFLDLIKFIDLNFGNHTVAAIKKHGKNRYELYSSYK